MSEPFEPGHTLASWKVMAQMNTLETVKELLKSKTIWGVVLLLVNNTILKEAPLDDQFGEQAAGALTGFIDAIGAVLAVWGRLTARGPLIERKVS